MNNKKITIVINTFQSEDKIFQCLDAISSEFKVIIIENSNNKNFKEMLEKKYINVDCYLTGENLGYAKGNNLGLSKVKSEYALILNPDAIIEKNTLNNFLLSAEKIKDFSILGPAKQNEFENNDTTNEREQIFEVNSLKGFAMFLNLSQFKEIGFFDDNFFIYLEEIDLCKRLKESNKKILLDKNILISHIGGSSHNKSINFEMELSRNWHWMWSTFYFHKKHYGYLSAIIKILPKLFSSFFKFIIFFITFQKSKSEIYRHRLLGIINSVLLRKSSFRPKL